MPLRGSRGTQAGGPRPATARGAVTRARIVKAAADLVYRRGTVATSLEDIMEASATSKSQLYHYFADKDALMRAVIEFQTDRVTGGEAVRPEALNSLDGIRRWRDAVVTMNKAARGVGGCPLGSLVSQLADRSESARASLANGFELWESHFRQGLSAMRDRGELNPRPIQPNSRPRSSPRCRAACCWRKPCVRAGRSNSRSTWRSATSRDCRCEGRRPANGGSIGGTTAVVAPASLERANDDRNAEGQSRRDRDEDGIVPIAGQADFFVRRKRLVAGHDGVHRRPVVRRTLNSRPHNRFERVEQFVLAHSGC